MGAPYKICAMTGTRAEYGLLYPLLCRLNSLPEQFDLRILACGMHLCAEYGYTYKEIEEGGFLVDEKIEMLLSSDTAVGTTKSVGLAMISFADYFSRRRPDLLILLGDRFEAFACASSAAFAQIPIAHLYGGDLTEGLIDEFIRHSITKMSYLHFVSNEQSRQRVIQLGEEPTRVWNVGSFGVENAAHIDYLSREELQSDLKFPLDKPYAVATFHPVTLESETAEEQMRALLEALSRFPELRVVFTKSNADAGGRAINALLDEAAAVNPMWIAIPSLGVRRYLSALRYASFVIGNSSSGLYEVPSFKIPTINIGDRQQGRLQADSIINCPPDIGAIVSAVKQAQSREWREKCKKVVNPFGDGNTSARIIEQIGCFLERGEANLKKPFFDLKEGGLCM